MQIRFGGNVTPLFSNPASPVESGLNEAQEYFRQAIQGPRDNLIPLASGLYMMNVALANLYIQQQTIEARMDARIRKSEAILQNLAGKGAFDKLTQSNPGSPKLDRFG